MQARTNDYGRTNRPTIDADQLAHELEQRGIAWADAAAAADALEDARKSVLAQESLQSDEKSAAAREMVALASHSYRQHLEALKSARRTANRARVMYDVMRVHIDLLRSQVATERALAVMR